jgi:Zn-dependent protease with chaperone function
MGEVPTATTIRAALAVALLAGFYVLAVALIGTLAWLSVWLWLTVPGEIAQGASLATTAATVGLTAATWRLLRARPESPMDGLVVSEQQAPELWSQVRELAEAVGTRPPDEIRLGFEANAAVWEDARLLGLRPGRRYLYLGVPFLRACEPGQMRAVLAHELGHYSRQHTRLGVLTYRGMRAIVHTIEAVGPASAAGLLFTGYAAIYAYVSLAVMRRMELEADRASLRVAGYGATVLALRDTPRVALAWEVFLASYVKWNRDEGYTPAELLAWFIWLIENRRDEVDRAGRKRAGPSSSSRWDSHPSTNERIAAIKTGPGTPGPLDPASSEALVGDLDLLVDALRTDGFTAHLEEVAQQEAERDADWLYDTAAKVVGFRKRGLGSVLGLLADGRRTDLTGADDELIFAAIASAVVTAGGASWRHSWSAPMSLVRDDEPVELRPLVEQACRDVAGVEPLRIRLIELGVDEARVVADRTGLDIGPVFRTLAGTEPSTNVYLGLPDELFLLSYGPSGRRRLDITAFEAGLAGAVLAELRLRGRVRLADNGDTTVIVADATATGDRFLDSALVRIATGAERPAYQWIQALGPDVAVAVSRRLSRLDLYEGDTQTHAANRIPLDPERHQRARSAVKRALDTSDVESFALALATLLWATELAAPVLGRTALGSLFWLGQVAKRDELAVAVRTVIGLGAPLPHQNSGGS